MKNVGGRRVVHNDDLAEVAAQSAQVLDIVAAVKDAGLAEEAAAESAPFVQQVRDGVSVLPKPPRKEKQLCVSVCVRRQTVKQEITARHSPWLNWL